MPMQRKRLPNGIASPGGPGDKIIFVSIALVVTAVVAGLHVQMGLPLGLAAIAGMSLFIGLVGFQAWRRGEAERAKLAEELRWLAAAQSPRSGMPAPIETPMVPAGVQSAGAAVPPAPFTAPSTSSEGPGASTTPVTTESIEGLAASERPQFEPYPGGPSAPPGQSFSDYWPLPEEIPTADWQPPAPAPDSTIAAVTPSAVREDDVEMLQRRIKDMLYQVTAAEQARELAAALPDAAALEPSLAVDASVDALQAAAQSLRERVEVSIAPDGEPVATASPNAADLQLSDVREAISTGRVEVFLEPILGLGDQSTQHYEVSVRLRGRSMNDLGDGTDDLLTGRGLLPLFDVVRIERSAIVAELLKSRGKTGAVFSRASGEALLEPDFTRNMQMDFVARPSTARQLILTFSQSDIRSFRAAEQRAVSALSALGFRFAISGLTDLDMNFGAMAKAGFGFVKIDAAVLLNGLPHPGGHIPASDVCRFLADQGFGLIVEGIESEEMLAKVFGFGVLMGQGALFGGPRPVKADVVTKRGQAA